MPKILQLSALSAQKQKKKLYSACGDTDITEIIIIGGNFNEEAARALDCLLDNHQTIANKLVGEHPKWLIWGTHMFLMWVLGYELRGNGYPINKLAILQQQQLEDKTVHALIRALKWWKVSEVPNQVRSLSLAGSQLTEKQFYLIFSALSFCAITDLNLSNTNLDNAIFEKYQSLLLNSQVKTLQLQGNQLTNVTAQHIKTFLEENLKVIEIGLLENNISSELREGIRNCLADNLQIQAWLNNLNGNTTFGLPTAVDDLLIYRVAKMLTLSDAIKELDLNDVNLTANQHAMLEAALLKNFSLQVTKNGTITSEEQRLTIFNNKILKNIKKISYFKVGLTSFLATFGVGLLIKSLTKAFGWSLFAKTIAVSLVPIAAIVMLIAPIIAYQSYQILSAKLPRLKDLTNWDELTIHDSKLGQACQQSYLQWMRPRAWTTGAYLGYHCATEDCLVPEQPSSSSAIRNRA